MRERRGRRGAKEEEREARITDKLLREKRERRKILSLAKFHLLSKQRLLFFFDSVLKRPLLGIIDWTTGHSPPARQNSSRQHQHLQEMVFLALMEQEPSKLLAGASWDLSVPQGKGKLQ